MRKQPAPLLSSWACLSKKCRWRSCSSPRKKPSVCSEAVPPGSRGYVEESAASTAAAYLKEILRGMGYDKVEIEIKEEEKGCQLALSGEEFGSIIGRRGETLDALQYLTGLVANGWTTAIIA